jgi:hypothetical protein
MRYNLHRAGFTIIELFIAIIGLASLAGVIALVWVAAHFIAKLW